jgi:hypothetical protein
MKTKTILALITGMVISLSAWTQEQPQAQKNLMQFAGKWKSSDVKLTMGGKTYTGEYTFDCSAVNGNTGIVAHEKFVNAELGTMLAENLVGYDPNLQQVHIYTIDNMGTTHDHAGYWIGNNHLFVQYQGVMEGKMYLEQIDLVFQDNKMMLSLKAMLNGEIFEQAKGSFVK